MSDEFIANYISSLDLAEIRNPQTRETVRSIVTGYLEKALKENRMAEALRKIPLIIDQIKWLKHGVTGLTVLEAIEHVQAKLEQHDKFGPPTLPQLYEYAPKGAAYRVPSVFYEHPELRKIRVIATVEHNGKDSIVDTRIVDVNQLKIHYIVGNLDRQIVNMEETPCKILSGPVRFDWDGKFRYVAINSTDTQYPHDFDAKDVKGVFHLSPNRITMRAIPPALIEDDGVRFCPSCYNLYDNDEISTHDFLDHQSRVHTKIRNMKLQRVSERWSFCPNCSSRIFRLNDPKEIEKRLLFSYLYRSNAYPDTVPIVERSAYIDKSSIEEVINNDRTLNSLITCTTFTSSACVSELVKGFTRIIGIQFSERYRPTPQIYLWHQRNLRKGDRNVYYYYDDTTQAGTSRKYPARISIEIAKTDALCFDISDAYETPLSSIRTPMLVDLIISSVRIVLSEEFPNSNLFALNSITEVILAYFLLSLHLRMSDSGGVFEKFVRCVKDLYEETSILSHSIKTQDLDFQPASVSDVRTMLGTLPLEFSRLSEKQNLHVGNEDFQITKKLALILWLFGVGERLGNLYISSNKRHSGLDIDEVLLRLLKRFQNPQELENLVKNRAEDVYLHTMSHFLYRSSVEVAKCGENDLSYDYDRSREIIIYDNYSGGAGFTKECSECFDNLRHEKRYRPHYGFLQQLESDASICVNYLTNMVLYNGISGEKLDDLVHRTDQDVQMMTHRIMSKFNLIGSVYDKVVSATYGRNIGGLIHSLVKGRVPILYSLLRQIFNLEYDGLVLIQDCPTIFLFVLLCKLDNRELAIFLRHILRHNTQSKDNPHEYSILGDIWSDVFESEAGPLFSQFNRKFLPIFENSISTCVKGCYDCVHLSSSCKYPLQEQSFRLNTYITGMSFRKLREQHRSEFPKETSELHSALERAKKAEASYLSFKLTDFPKIEPLFNTFLNESLTYDLERVRPYFIFDTDGEDLMVYVKLRKRLE